MNRTTRAVLSSVAVATLASCVGDETPAVGTVAVRDSAGIRIVEHSSLPAELDSWSVASEPDLSIGALEGTGPDVFGRVAAVTETPDGVIVVADGIPLELRAFDSSGSHLWTVGGRGEGPGEFAALTAVAAFGNDSIAAFDSRALRMTVFTAEGGLARNYRVIPPSDTRPPIVAGMTRGGALVGLGSKPSGFPSEMGPYQAFVDALFYDPVGSLVAVGPSLPEADYVLTQPVTGGAAPRMYLRMGRRTQLAVGTESVAVTTQARFEVLRYRPTGELDEIIRVATPALSVDTERYAASNPRFPGGFMPDSLPAMNRIRLDVADRLWVEEYVPPYDDRIPTWWVLASGGEFVAQVTIPVGFTPHAIGTDHIVGVTEDSLGVGYVERRRLIR